VATAFVKVAAAPHWNVTTVNTYRTDRGLEYVLVDAATLPLLQATPLSRDLKLSDAHLESLKRGEGEGGVPLRPEG